MVNLGINHEDLQKIMRAWPEVCICHMPYVTIAMRHADSVRIPLYLERSLSCHLLCKQNDEVLQRTEYMIVHRT